MSENAFLVYWAFFLGGIYLTTSLFPAVRVVGLMSVIIAAAGCIGFVHGKWITEMEHEEPPVSGLCDRRP